MGTILASTLATGLLGNKDKQREEIISADKSGNDYIAIGILVFVILAVLGSALYFVSKKPA